MSFYGKKPCGLEGFLDLGSGLWPTCDDIFTGRREGEETFLKISVCKLGIEADEERGESERGNHREG